MLSDAIHDLTALLHSKERVPGTVADPFRLEDDVVEVLRASGLHRALVPVAFGGVQAPLPDVMDAIGRVARIDGSTAWCAAIGGTANAFAGHLQPSAAAEIFADPDVGNAVMFSPVGIIEQPDAPTLTGRWSFVSNVAHSEWIGLGALARRRDGSLDPEARVQWVRSTDIVIDRTWDGPGLPGSGSHHVVADSVPVELDRSRTWTEASGSEEPMWRIPLFCIFATLLGAVPLGIARGAIDRVGCAIKGGRVGARGSLADDHVAVAEFARAASAVRGAEAGLRASAERLWNLAATGRPISKRLQAEAMLASNVGCETAVEVTSTAHRLGGGAAAYAGSAFMQPLQDIHAVRQHVIFGTHTRLMLGHAIAGVDVVLPPVLL